MYDFFTLELKSTHSLREQSFYRCRMDGHALTKFAAYWKRWWEEDRTLTLTFK